MSYGLLLLRVVAGLTLAAHGSQKIFGWFGGYGPRGTGQFFGQLGFRGPVLMAVAAGASEFGGGLLLASGFLTPVAGFLFAVVMLNAIVSVHWDKGFWVTNGGYEFNVALATIVIAVVATGPGRFALDRAIGWDDNITGLWWAVGALGAAAVAAFLTLTLGREAPARGVEPTQT